jgi:NTE family protein
MNAVVMADGLAAGGHAQARVALDNFWRRVSDAAIMSPFRRGPLEVLTGRWTLDYSPIFVAMDLAARVFSPYDLNPRDNNPLRDILAESVDFERASKAPMKIFVNTTHVRTGRGRVFRNRKHRVMSGHRLLGWTTASEPGGQPALPAVPDWTRSHQHSTDTWD